jgi:hypothetical protein
MIEDHIQICVFGASGQHNTELLYCSFKLVASNGSLILNVEELKRLAEEEGFLLRARALLVQFASEIALKTRLNNNIKAQVKSIPLQYLIESFVHL